MRLNLLPFPRPVWLLSLLVAAAAPASAEIGKQAENKVEPRPAIWLLADEDTKIYLFGTVHILPPGFRWRSPAIDRVIEQADELVVETYDEPGKAEHLDARRSFLLPAPVPILSRVPPERRAALTAAISETKLPSHAFDGLQTWAAGMMLGVAQLLGSYGAEDPGQAPGVEDVLEALFRAAGKPISSVEDPGDVVASLNALPDAVQVELLLEAIEPREALSASSAAEDRHWVSGDVDAIATAFLKEFPAALFEPLLRRRNQAWAGWLAERLDRPGTVLFAVGAGHLAGEDSVQLMLARRGLAVTRVN
jgi:hypothetical protein